MAFAVSEIRLNPSLTTYIICMASGKFLTFLAPAF